MRVIARALLCAALLTGCLEPRAEAESAQPARDRVTAAEESVRRYLENAVYTRVRTHAGGEEICESAATYPLLALARYRILGSEMRGDTALVEAEVSSVATLAQHPGIADRYVITQAVRTDTLHFPLLRAGPTSGWRICGYAREFIDFFGPNDVDDPAVEWRPAGASRRALKAAVDSLRGA
ncbi:MAG TPA: hypothetical protein VK420_02225 [Longimicrobium sp.]|jgi:hypothetical protein|nr:hypothetical protein [Longimicrobium sp.]